MLALFKVKAVKAIGSASSYEKAYELEPIVEVVPGVPPVSKEQAAEDFLKLFSKEDLP